MDWAEVILRMKGCVPACEHCCWTSAAQDLISCSLGAWCGLCVQVEDMPAVLLEDAALESCAQDNLLNLRLSRVDDSAALGPPNVEVPAGPHACSLHNISLTVSIWFYT